MKSLHLISSLSSLALAVTLPPEVPRNLLEFRSKHVYATPELDCRKTITIDPSIDINDDVSDVFREAVKEADNGGTLWLREGGVYVIGKALDLTGLNDFHLRLDGEIRVSCQEYTSIGTGD